MIRYCIYCHKTANAIRRENYKAGYRVPCAVRDTLRGFHSYGLKSEVKNNK